MEETKVKNETDFQLARRSFWRGLGSVFNLPGNYYEITIPDSKERQADEQALLSDWQSVGDDIRKARKKFEKEHRDKLCLNK